MSSARSCSSSLLVLVVNFFIYSSQLQFTFLQFQFLAVNILGVTLQFRVYRADLFLSLLHVAALSTILSMSSSSPKETSPKCAVQF